MSRNSLATVLFTALILTPACSESEAATVAGTYEIDVAKTTEPMIAEMKKAAGAEIPAEAMESMKKMFAGSLELKPDLTYSGTMKINMMGVGEKTSTTKGTWSIAKGTLTMNQTHVDGAEKAETVQATCKDGVLTCTQDMGGKSVTIYFNKKKS